MLQEVNLNRFKENVREFYVIKKKIGQKGSKDRTSPQLTLDMNQVTHSIGQLLI